ncbi:MAG: response regulator [Bacteroidales bacterium]|nr:response regulator [Bacteroidales bacterium]
MQPKALIKDIMLVEDNKLNQRLMESSLKKFGFRIHVANNGQEAVEMYKKDPKRYDLIIMDIMMPVMDGFEATRHIRIHEQKIQNRVPIIALTANTFDADREKCLSQGMDEYIAKPLDMNKLTRAFHELGLTEK